MGAGIMDNHTIARQLALQARTLANESGNLYRARAYRRAAETILGLEQPIATILGNEGRKGLERLPGIGPRLSAVIESMLTYSGARDS
jgi:DNA polymerase/3'-5' exonuclease PolX